MSQKMIQEQIESLLVAYRNRKDEHFRRGVEAKLHALGQLQMEHDREAYY